MEDTQFIKNLGIHSGALDPGQGPRMPTVSRMQMEQQLMRSFGTRFKATDQLRKSGLGRSSFCWHSPT